MSRPSDPSPDDRTTPMELPGESPAAPSEPPPGRHGSAYAAGEVVGGRYRIIRLLGEGGMGEVYEAHDSELDESVALKTVRPGIASDEKAIARFRREVQLARKVTHQNVSRLFDVGTHVVSSPGGREQKTLFVTMELLRGETLAELLARRGKLSISEALPIVQQICDALTAAHAAGIVHRDLKSANVILVTGTRSGTPRAVVTDFGLARNAGPSEASLTHTGQVIGTPAFMAPEQVEGGEITPAVDIYALGVLLFEIVSNRLPFEASTPVATALMRLRQPPNRSAPY